MFKIIRKISNNSVKYVRFVRETRLLSNSSSTFNQYSKNDESEKLFKGPSLEYFIANSTNPENKSIDVEVPPYLDPSILSGNKRKVYIETYGCQMNVNDTEIASSILLSSGYIKTDNFKDADVILLMTCSIREGAEQKIWRRLEALRALKRKRSKDLPPLKIGVLGCMAERLKHRLVEQEKIVDVVAGPDSYRDLPQLLAVPAGESAVNVMLSLDETYADVMPVRHNKDSCSAFVSIMRGCNNMCTYCIVPFTRGRERSRPISSILDEIRYLSDQGVKEVTLLGQNVNSYRDTAEASVPFILREPPGQPGQILSEGFRTVYKLKSSGLRFADLLHHVAQVNPEMRIRFTSPHPKDFPDEVLAVIRENSNLCKQLHMPAQSGNSQVLEAMLRGYSREAYLQLVQHIQDYIPDIALSSDFICGFCGETEEQHQDTVSLVNLVKYNYAFVFPYSLRQRTQAHRQLQDTVPQEVKNRRVREVLDVFRENALELNRKQLGSVQLVLVEGRSKRSEKDLAGRNDGNTKVIFPADELPSSPDGSGPTRPIAMGEYVAVKVEDCSSQVLKGKALYSTTLQDFYTEQLSCLRL